MMHLAHIALVQWHLFAAEDLPIHGDTAVLGQNRSGKSTLIDLIQAVMAGGSSRWYRFNRSAGETGGSRSERTLRGYCLGQLGEDDYLRRESVTHIALTFEDPTGAQPPVSVGLCIEASVNEDAQVVGRYVAPGVRVTSDMLVEDLGEGARRSAGWALVRQRLEQACATAGTELVRPEGPRNHIREYMRHLFTGRRFSDPERFIRAFVMALSFEDMKSVEGFVHNFLLARNDIDIGELRDSIQRYRDVQKDIHELEKRLEMLRALSVLVQDFAGLLEREEMVRGVARLAALVEAGSALFANLRERRDNARILADTHGEIARHEAEATTLREEEGHLLAQLAAQDAASRRVVVEGQLKAIEQERQGALRRLEARFSTIALAATLLDARERLMPLKLGVLFHGLDEIRAASGILQPPEWPGDPIAMEALIDAARTAATPALEKIRARAESAIAERIRLEGEIAAESERLAQARAGAVRLDDRTARLMAVLKAEGMAPRALCQVAEITQPDWREAAEALLGRDREAILVDPQHAARAVEILRADRDGWRGCRVVNTRRLGQNAQGVQAGTLASVFVSADDLALAFIQLRTGGVRLADTQAQLLEGGRAIMRDGAYNSGIIVEVLRTRDLKIGRAAVPLMQAELEARIADLRQLRDIHADHQRFHQDMARRLEPLLTPAEDRLDLLAEAIDRLDQQRAETRARLERIAVTVDPAIRQRLDAVRLQLREIEAGKLDLAKGEGEARRAGLEIERRLNAAEGAPGSWACLKFRRKAFRDRGCSVKSLRALWQAQKNRAPGRIVQEMAAQADEAYEARREREGEIREALGHYRVGFDGTAPLGLANTIMGEVKPWVEANVGALEENELIQYRRQADEAADQIGRLFRTALVHELNARFNDLRTELETLSLALRNRPLHNEIYTLKASPKEEFAALHRLARASEEDEGVLDALFGRGDPRDEEHAQALAEVERLLGDETLDFSAWQDYRNYFTFDLRMEDQTSGRQVSYEKRKGTASGAERQVPYYVIIGAALASIYHGARRQYEPAELGLGLAVFDEAFSKMDGPNQRTLLKFYEDIGLQIVIAAPSEKRAVVYENLDSVIDVFRYGDSASAESVTIKPLARSAMRAANPQHMDQEQLTMLLAAEGT
jgi:hypothetical protein